MSLATRCSHCGTMFRVVQDQLRVSEGWVRCGRCDTVFNAFDALSDLDAAPAPGEPDPHPHPHPQEAASHDAPPADVDDGVYDDVDPAARPPHDPDDDLPDPYANDRARDATLPDPYANDRARDAALPDPYANDRARIAAQAPPATWPALEPEPLPDEDDLHALAAAELRRTSAGDSAAPSTNVRDDDRWDDEQDPAGVGPAPAAAAASAAAASGLAASQAFGGAGSAGTSAPAAPTPGFVRRADREARWNSPAMRAALVGSAALLGLLALLQVTLHFRDDIAVRSEAAAGVLRAACQRWGCEVGAPRRLDQVKLETSALSRVAQNPQAVRLSVQLRNRSRHAVALPAIDLSLSDPRGQLIARRMLMPGDFRIDPPVIPGASELPLELTLSAGERNVSNYSVELFYP